MDFTSRFWGQGRRLPGMHRGCDRRPEEPLPSRLFSKPFQVLSTSLMLTSTPSQAIQPSVVMLHSTLSYRIWLILMRLSTPSSHAPTLPSSQASKLVRPLQCYARRFKGCSSSPYVHTPPPTSTRVTGHSPSDVTI